MNPPPFSLMGTLPPKWCRPSHRGQSQRAEPRGSCQESGAQASTGGPRDLSKSPLAQPGAQLPTPQPSPSPDAPLIFLRVRLPPCLGPAHQNPFWGQALACPCPWPQRPPVVPQAKSKSAFPSSGLRLRLLSWPCAGGPETATLPPQWPRMREAGVDDRRGRRGRGASHVLPHGGSGAFNAAPGVAQPIGNPVWGSQPCANPFPPPRTL